MRLVILGTGPFAVPTLRALASSRHEVLRVVTRPPRERRAPPAPMLLAAQELGIVVWQPDTVNSAEALDELRRERPDLFVVCDYGEILKPPMLAVAPLGGVNLHGSLLPKYRGAAPVQWAILNGDSDTGNSVIQMTPGLDAGPLLGVERVAIDPDETAGELEARLAEAGAALALAVVDDLAAGTATATTQDPSQASKAPRLKKEDGLIDWSRAAATIKNQVRALDPWPRAFTRWHNGAGEPQRLIIHRVAVATSSEAAAASAEAGAILTTNPRLLVATGGGVVEILALQPAGKRTMSASEFLRGHTLAAGERLGP